MSQRRGREIQRKGGRRDTERERRGGKGGREGESAVDESPGVPRWLEKSYGAECTRLTAYVQRSG